MELETQETETKVEEPVEPAAPVSNRFLFVDIAALRAKQLRRGARARIDQTPHDGHQQPHKAERVAMEEVKQRLVQFDLPAAKKPAQPQESGA
jgi:DNA-directed RNA polymerase subunit K/omega